MLSNKTKYLSLYDKDEHPAFEQVLLVGIVYQHPAYRLAWHLNKNTPLQLARQEDIIYPHPKGEDVGVQCFEYIEEEYGTRIRLVGNKTYNNILIQAHANTPYFLLAKGSINTDLWHQILAALKNGGFAATAYEIEVPTFKNKDIIYFLVN